MVDFSESTPDCGEGETGVPPSGNSGQANVCKLKLGHKRRMVVSESARKLAEARREFLLKHQNRTPDRAKLTMYDLIYYNPANNPMKQQPRNIYKRPIPEESPDTQEKDDTNGSNAEKDSSVRTDGVADGDGAENEEEADTEETSGSAMPVPQVKVGPDGQLIIDEQSLVIEQTDAQKNREALARTEVLVDEENSSGRFYKRRKKSKEWPKWDTFKFYKALNTVGTDFLLMQSLFPDRTRNEIKMKFKKEEKTNRKLVEKALTYHQEFDIEALKQELSLLDEHARQEEEKKTVSNQPTNKETGREKKRPKSRRIVASSIEEIDESDMEDLPLSKRVSRSKSHRRSGKRVLDEDEAEEEDEEEFELSYSCSDSDTEVYKVRPTRSGRRPKVRKIQSDSLLLDLETSEEEDDTAEASKTREEKPRVDTTSEEKEPSASSSEAVSLVVPEGHSPSELLTSSLPGMSHIEPGSLVVLSKESVEEPGKTVLQVYMVSSNAESTDDSQVTRTMKPVDLSPELLATVTTKISEVEPVVTGSEKK